MDKFAAVLKDFWSQNQKWLKIVLPSVLALVFIGSILLAVFGGGEFAQSDGGVATVKGLLRIQQAEYTTEYSVGDTFVFDDETCVISLIAKDPAITKTVKIDNLPRSEFAFMVNGTGTVYENPSDIIIGADVEYVSVVSTYYTNLKTDIPITVLGLEEEEPEPKEGTETEGTTEAE